MGEPGQGLYLNLRPAQFPKGFLGCIQFQMAIGGAQGGFQLREVLRAEPRANVKLMKVSEINSAFDPKRDLGNPDYPNDYEVSPLLWEIRRERCLTYMINN